jgi:serine/threonine protein kinase
MDAPSGYRLEKSLYADGAVEVRWAVRLSDERKVFVHVLRGGGERARDATRSAFELLQRLDGAGCLKPLELHDLLDPPLFVTEAWDGLLLASALEAGPLSPRTFLPLALEVVAAVEALHALRVVHRDLSPGRILIDLERAQARLLDLSLCTSLGKAQAQAHSIEGTLAYIAPEQTGRMARGIDLRSDLYMLGATFYHALAGEPPFRSSDPLELVHAHLARRPRPLAELRPDCPNALARIVHRLLEKEPDGRYQSARALAADLTACRSALEQRGEIPDDLQLGSADAPVRPLFRRRLYGRDAQAL